MRRDEEGWLGVKGGGTEDEVLVGVGLTSFSPKLFHNIISRI